MSDAAAEELELDDLLERVAELIDQVTDETALELLDYLEAWHREGITRLATAIPTDALVSAREDPVVAHLLDTYLGDDEEDAPEDVVEAALAEIRPYVHSHGGEMEVVGVEDGVITLRLLGSCDGCPSSAVTLTQGVEGILKQRWPGFRELRVAGEDESAPRPKLLQIESLKRS